MSAIHRDNDASIRLTEQTFDEAVAANTKLLLVDFWAEWCGPCRAIAPVLEELGRAEAQRVTVAKVNVDENPTLAARFGVRSIPTILFFKGDALVDQVVGALPRARLQARIDALARSAPRLGAARARAARRLDIARPAAQTSPAPTTSTHDDGPNARAILRAGNGRLHHAQGRTIMSAVTVHSKTEIPDADYRKMVLTLMDKQASREVATAEVFGQCVLFAPTVEDKIRITRFQHEELKHFQLLARLMSELGVDMDAYVRDRQRAGARFTGDEADTQIADWIDATLFNFMIDRAATFQLTEYTRGSYVPLARANEVILREEEGHKNFGEECLEAMCQDPATRAEIQRRFKKWFVASMRIFGRAGTPGNQYCLKVGLKTRDSGDVAAAYIDSIRPVMTRCGLRFPDRSELPLELPSQVDLTVPAPTPGSMTAIPG